MEEALSSIDDMCKVTGHTVSEDVASSWKFHRDVCVDHGFNVSWFVEGFSKIEKLHTMAVEGISMDEVAQQEAKIKRLSRKLKLKRAALESTKEASSKKSKPLLDDFP